MLAYLHSHHWRQVSWRIHCTYLHRLCNVTLLQPFFFIFIISWQETRWCTLSPFNSTKTNLLSASTTLILPIPCYRVVLLRAAIYLFFCFKSKCITPPRRSRYSQHHLTTFRKVLTLVTCRKGGGGDTKLTFVQPVQIVPYTLSHSVDQMSHSQTARGDWRCGSHSDGSVRPSLLHRERQPLVTNDPKKGSHQNSSSELSASSMAWSWRLVPGSRGCWGKKKKVHLILNTRLILRRMWKKSNKKWYWPLAVWPSSSGVWSCFSFCGESSWCCRGRRRLAGPQWCQCPQGPASQTRNPPAEGGYAKVKPEQSRKHV